MPSTVDQLRERIAIGKISFQKPELQAELLGENQGTRVTSRLQSLVLNLSLLGETLNISSVIRLSGHHGTGRAIDIGNESIASVLLPKVIPHVREWGIDELIYDAGGSTLANRNRWNHDSGSPHQYDSAILDQHKDHIHFAVVAGA